MPKWCSTPEGHPNLKEFTSGVQKLGAAGVLPVRDVNFINEVLEQAGFKHRIDPNDKDWMDKMSDETSRAGDGMKEGLNNGVGSSTSKGKDRSVSNNDNN
jgi:hypothetical protein